MGTGAVFSSSMSSCASSSSSYRRRGGLAVVIGLAGLVVLIGPKTILGHGDVDATATGVLMIGALSWAAGSIFTRHSARPSSSAMATGLQMIGGSASLLILGALLGELNGFSLANVSAP